MTTDRANDAISETLDDLRQELSEYKGISHNGFDPLVRAIDIAIADCERRIAERVKWCYGILLSEPRFVLSAMGIDAAERALVVEECYRHEQATKENRHDHP